MKILALGAHPDDIEFGCAPVLIQEARAGHEVRILVTSKGEAASAGTPEERADEAREAAKIIGASIDFLDLGGDCNQAYTPANAALIAREIRTFRPDIILAPHPGENQHPDHAVLGKLTRDGYTIDPFFIDRVEVIFGSNAIQGVGATGGVVNYVTARTPAEGEGLTGRMMAQITTDDELQGDGVGAKIAAIGGRDFGALDLTLGAVFETRGAYYDADGRRIGFDGAQGEVQDSQVLSLFARGGWDLDGDRRLEGWVNQIGRAHV